MVIVMLTIYLANELRKALLLRQVQLLSICRDGWFVTTYKDALDATLPNDTFLLLNHRCFIHDHLL